MEEIRTPYLVFVNIYINPVFFCATSQSWQNLGNHSLCLYLSLFIASCDREERHVPFLFSFLIHRPNRGEGTKQRKLNMDVKHIHIPTPRTIHDGLSQAPIWGWPTATIDWCEESKSLTHFHILSHTYTHGSFRLCDYTVYCGIHQHDNQCFL